MVVKNAVLKELEEMYTASGNQLCVLYGRADSEKELLIKTFVREKKYFYYHARQASAEMQKTMMGEEIAKNFQVELKKNSYEEYFNRIKSGGPSKLVIVIDEVQYIVKKDAEFMKAILKLRGKRLYPGPVLILLLSSSVSWVEKEMADCIGEEAEQKIDKKIKLNHLNFLEVVRALPEYPVSECIKVYGVAGGVPGYINHWNTKADFKSNICRLVLSRNGYMYNEAEKIIGTGLRELSVYDTILSCIASGDDKLNDLYLKTGFSRAKISVYMKNLSASDIIQKVVSFETGGWDNAKKGVYRIRDNYVNFWFRFVYPHLSDLYMMSPEEFYDAYIAPDIEEYVSQYFVEVCMEYLGLLNLMNKLPMKITKMGTWVGKEGTIDIIAQNSVRENLVGLCNWEKPEMTLAMCEDLFKNMKKAKIDAKYYFFFSAKSFDAALKEMAEQDERFILVDMNEL